MSSTTHSPRLLGIEACRIDVFPDPASAPASRTFKKWMAARYFPVHKIGRRVFLDPEEVRRALDRRFKINAIDAD
jgi:hypothetical protein